MRRLGWAILLLVLLGIGGIISFTSFGTAPPRSPVAARPVPPADGAAGALVVPVAGVGREQLTDSWGDARGGGTRAHHGIDIMAPRGTPVRAAAAGTVEKLFTSRLGGIATYVRTVDGGTIHYYAHLDGYAPSLHEGQRVAAGETIGFVGDTGDAGPGNTHLHFGVQRMRAGERWWQGQDVNPYPLLAGSRPSR